MRKALGISVIETVVLVSGDGVTDFHEVFVFFPHPTETRDGVKDFGILGVRAVSSEIF